VTVFFLAEQIVESGLEERGGRGNGQVGEQDEEERAEEGENADDVASLED
jgi:hypothetical protein